MMLFGVNASHCNDHPTRQGIQLGDCAACLLHRCLKSFQQGRPFLSLRILVDPAEEVFVVALAPGLPDQAVEGVQQGQQGIPRLHRLEASYQVRAVRLLTQVQHNQLGTNLHQDII